MNARELTTLVTLSMNAHELTTLVKLPMNAHELTTLVILSMNAHELTALVTLFMNSNELTTRKQVCSFQIAYRILVCSGMSHFQECHYLSGFVGGENMIKTNLNVS